MSTIPSACERLAQSRERLRQALYGVGGLPDTASPTHPKNFMADWLTQLQTQPGAGLLLGVFQTWWEKQPLRIALTLAAQTSKLVLQPVALRHPYALVAGAATIGALLVLVRPWRWISTPALLAGLLPQVMSEIVKRLPTQCGPVAPPGPHAP